MKGEEIINIIETGVKPLVKITKYAELGEFNLDEGMIGRVINYKLESDGVVMFDIDISEYLEYNKTLAKKNYYNKNGIPCLSFFETPYYTSNVVTLYTMFDDARELEFYKQYNSELYNEYKNSNTKMSYVEFLENKIKELKNIKI